MKYQVTANHVHLRKGPSLDEKINGVVHAGEVVTCVKMSGDEYWQKVENEQGVVGWMTHKHLICLEHDEDIDDNEAFPWMAVAIRELGKKSYTGYADHPRIVDYLSSTNLGKTQHHHDVVPWASAFVNWCVEKSGCYGTDSAWAKSWAEWGQVIDAPTRGSIAVLRVRHGGHVGFYIETVGDKVMVLGANKINEVSYQYFPKEDVAMYRVPVS